MDNENLLEVLRPVNTQPDREKWDGGGMDYRWGETDHQQASEVANLSKRRKSPAVGNEREDTGEGKDLEGKLIEWRNSLDGNVREGAGISREGFYLGIKVSQ